MSSFVIENETTMKIIIFAKNQTNKHFFKCLFFRILFHSLLGFRT